MSVINQMLEDLERRLGDARPDAIGPEVRAVPRKQSRLGLASAVVLAAVVAGVAAARYWTGERAGPESSVVGTAEPSTAAGPTPAMEASAPAPSAETEPASAVQTSAGTETETPALVVTEEAGPPAGPATPAPRRPERTAPEPRPTVPGPGGSSPTPDQPVQARPEAPPVQKPGSRESAPDAARRVQALASPDAGPEAGSPGTAPPAPKPAAPPAPATGEAVPQSPPVIDKKLRPLTPEERAENEFRRGLAALEQRRDGEAVSTFNAVLKLNPHHEAARQTLVATLLQQGQLAEAERLLLEGLALNPRQVGFAATAARLQVERGDPAAALRTLEAAAPHAGSSAEFHAFFAALLQRVGRHRDAVEHYRQALQLAPGTGVWLLGMGISLQADGRPEEARAAFEQARASRQLNAELTAFVDRRISELRAGAGRP